MAGACQRASSSARLTRTSTDADGSPRVPSAASDALVTTEVDAGSSAYVDTHDATVAAESARAGVTMRCLGPAVIAREGEEEGML